MNRSRSCGALFAILVTIVALSFFLLLVMAWAKSGQVNRAFGPPSSNLNVSERLSYTWRLSEYIDEMIVPISPFSDSVEFEIGLGESPITVSARLQETGLIRNADAFLVYLV